MIPGLRPGVSHRSPFGPGFGTEKSEPTAGPGLASAVQGQEALPRVENDDEQNTYCCSSTLGRLESVPGREWWVRATIQDGVQDGVYPLAPMSIGTSFFWVGGAASTKVAREAHHPMQPRASASASAWSPGVRHQRSPSGLLDSEAFNWNERSMLRIRSTSPHRSSPRLSNR